MSSPPTTLGQYQIIREIARSNDIVYEAYDPLMNRRVAVKELAAPPGISPQQRDERINRFKREAQAAGSLNHPNIMTVYSFAEDQGRHFMAMEYLDGHTLRNEIDTKGFLTLDRSVEIALAVLEGLAHAHSKGVIHRDIKPDNIQILSNDTIKITDFGIARLTFQPNLTMDGQVFGTPSYMSPEQVVGKEIDQRSDLFSLGIVLYEMLSGQKPFTGDNVMTISYAIMNKEPLQSPTIPDCAWQVIRKALEKAPSLRYQDAEEFMAALRASVKKLDVLEPPVFNTPYGAFPNPAFQNPPPPVATPAYAYNPYGGVAPPPVVAAPQAPQSAFPAPQAIPIYYPPPPRQPLLKPEQRLFLKRLAVTILLVGTLFLVVVVGISELSKAVQRWQAERADAALVSKIRSPGNGMKVDQQIKAYESLRDRLQSQNRIEQANRDIAVLYETQGKQALAKNDLIGAEQAFLESVNLDPRNSALYSNLGDLYSKRITSTPNPGQRDELLYSGARAWNNAAKYEFDPSKRAGYGKAAAQLALYYAQDMAQGSQDQRDVARQLLYEVRSSTAIGSTEMQQIDKALEQIR